MFDEYFNPPNIAVSQVPIDAEPRIVDIVDSPMSTSIELDTPSTTKAADKNMTIFQLDVKTVFLNGEIKEEVYVSSIDRICDQGQPSRMCHVSQKAMYGLKQAPCAWYDMLSSFLISQHFFKGAVDPTLFIRKAGNDLLLVQIYVDDLIFASTNTALCNEFANLMTTKFKMLMMGQNVILFRITNFTKSQRHLPKPIKICF
ncbi:retrovirus-related pol polyprotein from transposon TNT 1-94 [Tanacetum coccineum]